MKIQMRKEYRSHLMGWIIIPCLLVIFCNRRPSDLNYCIEGPVNLTVKTLNENSDIPYIDSIHSIIEKKYIKQIFANLLEVETKQNLIYGACFDGLGYDSYIRFKCCDSSIISIYFSCKNYNHAYIYVNEHAKYMLKVNNNVSKELKKLISLQRAIIDK